MVRNDAECSTDHGLLLTKIELLWFARRARKTIYKMATLEKNSKMLMNAKKKVKEEYNIEWGKEDIRAKITSESWETMIGLFFVIKNKDKNQERIKNNDNHKEDDT